MRLHDTFVRTIKGLTMDAIERAQSGHPGMPLGMADAAAVLWMNFLKHDPSEPEWPDRDRFILSAGHGSMLLYSLLHLTGYFSMPMEELRRFRQWGSKTPGHPENHLTAGVEMTTGPLGQGFATAVGFALAEQFLAARYNQPGFALFDHYTYAIVSDGDLMEGVASEAASLAGHLGLGKLVFLYDDNRISIDGSTTITFTENVDRRFEAYGWHVQAVDGHDAEAVRRAVEVARAVLDRPSLIRCETRIARGAPTLEGSAKSHGSPLGATEVAATKAAMGWPAEEFHVPAAVREWSAERQLQWGKTRREWEQRFAEYKTEFPELARELGLVLSGDLPPELGQALPHFEAGKKLATRQASGAVIQALAAKLPTLVGGSADLAASNNTKIATDDYVSPGNFGSRNVHFGVREHAMAAVANGMSRHGGVFPFTATFLQFSDYMRPAVRLAALMQCRVVHVWTHDSIFLGEDGPTHQPVEHLSALRAIPNLAVFRPADANETKWCWLAALSRSHGPSGLALTRQALPTLAETERAAEAGVPRGAYVLWQADATPTALLLATGSEVSLALAAAKELAAEGVSTRVVSMPCWELFAAQEPSYQEEVLPRGVTRRVVVEAGVSHGWQRWAGATAAYVTLDEFGQSAPAEVLAEKFGFTVPAVKAAVRSLL
jgi:transketolase